MGTIKIGPSFQDKDGNAKKGLVDENRVVQTSDINIQLLEKILLTLRKIEFHLSQATSDEIHDGEIDEED